MKYTAALYVCQEADACLRQGLWQGKIQFSIPIDNLWVKGRY